MKLGIAAMGLSIALLGCDTQEPGGTKSPNPPESNANWLFEGTDGQASYLMGTTIDGTALIAQERDRDTGTIVRDFDLTGESMGQTKTPEAMTVGSTLLYVGYRPWILSGFSKETGKLAWSEQTSFNCSAVASIAFDDSGLYAGGHIGSACNSGTGYYDIKWHLEKRDSATGALLWEVKQQASQIGDIDFVSGVRLDSTDLYISRTGSYSNNPFIIEKISKSDGAVQWSMTISNNRYGKFVLNAGDIYVLFKQEYDSGLWGVQKRAKSDGSLLWEVFLDSSITKCASCRIGVIADRLYFASPSRPLTELSMTDGSIVGNSDFSLPADGSIFFDVASIYFITRPSDTAPQEVLRYVP